MISKPEPLIDISVEQFEHWPPALKVISHEHARRFAFLALANCAQGVALSWRSESVDPVVLSGGQSEVWLGVDQRVVCVTDQGMTLFSLGLGSSLLDIARFDDSTAVMCDGEVVVVNADYSIQRIHGLADIPKAVCFRNGKFVITFIDDSEETIG